MIGKFRSVNKINKRKYDKLFKDAFKEYETSPAIYIADINKYADPYRQAVENVVNELENVIRNGSMAKVPRKRKKLLKRRLTAKYNLHVIVLDSWDKLREIAIRDNQQAHIESQKEVL